MYTWMIPDDTVLLVAREAEAHWDGKICGFHWNYLQYIPRIVNTLRALSWFAVVWVLADFTHIFQGHSTGIVGIRVRAPVQEKQTR